MSEVKHIHTQFNAKPGKKLGRRAEIVILKMKTSKLPTIDQRPNLRTPVRQENFTPTRNGKQRRKG